MAHITDAIFSAPVVLIDNCFIVRLHTKSKRGLLFASFDILRFWTDPNNSKSTQKPTPNDVSVNELILE